MKIPNRRVVQAELVDEDEANISPQDTEPHGGTHEVPDQVSEHQWVPGDPFYDDQGDPFAYDPSEDLDRSDDERGDEDHYSDYTAEDERQKKVQAFLVESGYDAQFVPPWSPVPTALGKAFINQNRDAQIDIVFPTVYDEDRTAKIKDLATAQALDTITHHRMSDQIAKEMGFENYEYDEEQQQITEEKKLSQVDSAAVGIGDDIATTAVGMDVSPGGEITPKRTLGDDQAKITDAPSVPAGAGGKSPSPQVAPSSAGTKRGELSNVSTAQWKKYQGRNYEAQQPSVKRIVRDKRGLITKIIEE
jgi:hypothetical protein